MWEGGNGGRTGKKRTLRKGVRREAFDEETDERFG